MGNEKQRIRIAFFITNLGQGGAERQLVELLKALDKHRFEPYLFLYAYQKEAFYHEVFSIPGLKVTTNRLKGKSSFIRLIEAWRMVRKITSSTGFDLLFSTLFLNNFLVRIAAPSRYNRRIIANTRNSIAIYKWYHKLAERILIHRSYMVFNSQKAMHEFERIFPLKYHDRLMTIYNGFRIPNQEALPKEKHRNTFAIAGIGRQSKQKNFLQLVRVFQNLRKNFHLKPLQLVLQGGPGDESSQIIGQINENSQGITRLDADPDVRKILKEIDVLVISSHFEGCSNVLFEAMACQRLCIISEGANSDDFVINGVNGFEYNGTDDDLYQKLYDAVSILGTQDESRITDAAFHLVHEKFSIPALSRNYETLFVQLGAA